jgi:hypothetical protein
MCETEAGKERQSADRRSALVPSVSEPLRDNVLHGVTRRSGPPPGMPPPIRPPRLINVTFRVDDLSLNYARGRAVVEGTSISALVNRLLEEYSGIARPPGHEISRRIPMFCERRVRSLPDDPV